MYGCIWKFVFHLNMIDWLEPLFIIFIYSYRIIKYTGNVRYIIEFMKEKLYRVIDGIQLLWIKWRCARNYLTKLIYKNIIFKFPKNINIVIFIRLY